jgi:hypothetical protein
MHPALALAERQLLDLRAEYDQLLAIEADIIPGIIKNKSPVAPKAILALRATNIGSVYNGIEKVLKEILTVVDGSVFAGPESWHAQLLAQAASPNENAGRRPIISDRVYEVLDELRAFRHFERHNYRHIFRDQETGENLGRLKGVFPLFENDIRTFLRDFVPMSKERPRQRKTKPAAQDD